MNIDRLIAFFTRDTITDTAALVALYLVVFIGALYVARGTIVWFLTTAWRPALVVTAIAMAAHVWLRTTDVGEAKLATVASDVSKSNVGAVLARWLAAE